MKTTITFLLIVFTNLLSAQTLTISDAGETGISGTNWSTSGTNPVTLTATGDATINTSVIEGYLNAGTSVLLEGSFIDVSNAIDKTAGGDATLTIRGAGTNTEGYGRSLVNANIQSTSGALNIILWSDYNNHNRAGASVSSSPTINTNGGHFWVGGSASAQGSTTWNGLTVGDGPSVNAVGFTNQNAVDINGVALNTSGGDVFIWAAPGAGAGTQGIDFITTTINAATGDIILVADVISGAATLTSTGHLYLVPDGGAYGGAVTWSHNDGSPNINVSGTFDALNINAFTSLGGFTIGEYEGMAGVDFTNSSNVTIASTIAVAGPISIYGGQVAINENLIQTATGDIFIKGIDDTGTSVELASTKKITRTAGTGTVTLQGHGRVITLGDIEATGSANANIVLWSDFDNDNNDGGLGLEGDFITNGGHFWAGGSSTNGGTYTWNGLSVGDGPSIGTAGANFNALDFNSNLSTSGGNVLIWAGDGFSSGFNGIATDGTGYVINAGSGDVTLITNAFNGTGANGNNVQSTGVFTLVPNGGDFGSTLDWNPTVSSDDYNFQGAFEFLIIENLSDLTGLTIGRYEGFTDSDGDAVVLTNSSDIDLNVAMSVSGPISVYGGNIAVNENLNTTAGSANGDILLKGSGAVNLAASKSITTNNGDVTFWADSDADGGFITINAGNTITTQGGNLVLAGGLDDGSNGGVASDGIPDGFAWRKTNDTDFGGVSLGEGDISGAALISLVSNGGNILVRGKSSDTSLHPGILSQEALLIDSGTGTISMNGTSSTGHGIELAYGSTSHNIAIRSASNAGTAISLEGSTSANSGGFFLLGDGSSIIQSEGTGAVTVTGTSTLHEGLIFDNTQILSASGKITFTGTGPNNGQLIRNADIGLRSSATAIQGITPLAVSSADIDLIANSIQFLTASNTFASTGVLSILASGDAFSSDLTVGSLFDPSSSLTGLVIGKDHATAVNLTLDKDITIAGPISVYGGDIAINQNLNTTAGGTNGDILVKASGDISLTADESITTSGGDVILWANSDNQAANGSISLRKASSITTGSSSVTGGSVWLGGGADGGTWNGLSVGQGYAVPATDFIPSDGGSNFNAGVYLERSSIYSFGGAIKIATDASTGFAGLVTYGNTVNLDAGSGAVQIEVQNSVNSGDRFGILFGLHDIEVASTVNILSSSPADAITIEAFGSGTSDAIGSGGTLNVFSSGGGDVLISGDAQGSGRSIVSGNYYHGLTNIYANSGRITLDGHTNGVVVAAAVVDGLTTGPSKINIGQGGSITSSTSDVFITGDAVEIGAGGMDIVSSGSVTVQPSNTSFSSALSWPISNLSLNAAVSGLTLGKTGNTAAMTIAGATTIAGPIAVYGADIAINAATTATSSDINLYATGAVSQSAALTANRLALNGTGNFTLQNAANNVGIIAGGDNTTRLGNLAYRDADALEIGSVNPDGIFSSGTVLIETENGNLTLSQNINTTSTSDDAIIVNAGRAAAAGTGTGGNVIVSGSPTLTYGSGARAKLFSGIESTSTGLTTLVGGAANARAGFDENSTISPALADDNAFAIYRVSSGTGNLTIVASGGDAENSTWGYSNGILTTIANTANVNASDVVAKLALGDLSLEANQITFSANIANTTANAFNVRSNTHIINTNATTITSQGGDVLFASNVDDATDGESTVNGYIRLIGLTVTTNGGDITLGGENSNGTGYALGTSNNAFTEGIRINATTNLNSGGGNISIKGKSYNTAVPQFNGASGLGFYFLTSPGSINSGTGTILMDGYSQTSGSDASSGILFWNSDANTFTIQSSNTTANAITINGYATGASGQAYGMEVEGPNTLNIFATGVGGGITVNTGNSSSGYDLVLRGETNILAQSGPTQIKGGQFGGLANQFIFLSNNLFLGSKASTAISSSSSDITLQFDRFDNNPGRSKFATTGSVTVQPNATSFGMGVNSNFFDWNQNSQTMSGVTIGKSGNTSVIINSAALTAAGPIAVYGGAITINANLTSSANGDIFIKGISDLNPSIGLASGSSIIKSAGTGTLTMQGHGRVLNNGTITTSGTGVLNVVMWSDFDNDNNDGGVSHLGTISTNGGHVWLGGSSSDGGSYTWNSLTVGNGPSIGTNGFNANALDLFGNVTTSGGDFLAWAGNGHTGFVNGIGTDGTGYFINTGAGDITLITNAYNGTGFNGNLHTTTGTFKLVPNGGTFGASFNWNPNLFGSGDYDFIDVFNYMQIDNLSDLTGLVIGQTSEMSSGGTPVVIGNTSDIAINTAIPVAGPIAVYGGDIAINQNLNTTAGGANGDILLKASGNISMIADESITTSGGDVTFWADSDGSGAGYNRLNTSSEITTGGGNITLGGGSDIATGFSRGVGTVNGVDLSNGSVLNSQGGDIILRGQNRGSTLGNVEAGLMGRGTTLDAGAGKITLHGVATGSGSNNSQGVSINGEGWIIRSSNPDTDAIQITGDASGTSNPSNSLGINFLGTVESTGGGGILMTGKSGTASGADRPFQLRGAVLANAGDIVLVAENDVATEDGIRFDAPTSLLGSKAGTNVTSSSSNIIIKSDNPRFISATPINTLGTLSLLPLDASPSFGVELNIDNKIELSTSVSGLTLGKLSNTSNITFGTATTIAGNVTAYGGTINLDADLTTTNGGDVSLYTDNALGGLSTSRTLTAAGAFKYIPRGTAFTGDVSYPITNLTATSTGLTIGKATNDKDITINTEISGDAGVELYGGDIAINSNLKTTNSGNMLLKGNITVAAGKYIESNGNFTQDGDITFKSDANGTAAFGPLGGNYTTTSGAVQVERYIPARRAFRFLSSGVTTTSSINENWQENGGTAAGLGTHITGNGGATNGFDATATNNPSMFGFNNSTGQWETVTNTDQAVLTAGTPYRLMVRGDRTTDLTTNSPSASATTLRAKGALHTGDFTPSLNPAAEGFSFIGNPYQAPLDMEAVLMASSNMNTDVLYYWDPTLNTRGAYVTRTLGAAVNNVTSSFTEILQPGQGVFTKKDDTATAATMILSEVHKKVSDGAAGVFRASTNRIHSGATGLLRANLQATINNEWQTTDAALALFNANYTWGATQEDASKMNNLDEEVSFILANTSLAIAKQNSASPTDELPIKLNKLRHADYRWFFDLTNYNGDTPYLLDTEQNVFSIIEDGTVLPFTAGSNASNRFKIVFQNMTLNTPTFANTISLYPNPSGGMAGFYINNTPLNAKVDLFTLLGQSVPVTTSVNGTVMYVKPKMQLSKGVYLVQLSTPEGSTKQIKWIVE